MFADMLTSTWDMILGALAAGSILFIYLLFRVFDRRPWRARRWDALIVILAIVSAVLVVLMLVPPSA